MTQISMNEECCWPDLPERFDMALRELVSFVLARFNVAGIVAAGSIVRGTPDPTSDLDIYVVAESRSNSVFRDSLEVYRQRSLSIHRRQSGVTSCNTDGLVSQGA
jgi:predicted nucleotidyltransferase